MASCILLTHSEGLYNHQRWNNNSSLQEDLELKHKMQMFRICSWQMNFSQELHFVRVLRSADLGHWWHRPLILLCKLPDLKVCDAGFCGRFAIAGSAKACPSASKKSLLLLGLPELHSGTRSLCKMKAFRQVMSKILQKTGTCHRLDLYFVV